VAPNIANPNPSPVWTRVAGLVTLVGRGLYGTRVRLATLQYFAAPFHRVRVDAPLRLRSCLLHPQFQKTATCRWQSLPVGTLTRAPLPLYGIATCTPFSTLHHHRSTTHAAGRG